MNLICTRFLQLSLVATAVFSTAVCSAANVTGTVTNKTTGKPSSGDTVALVDVQAGMSDAATATTDGQGRYTLQTPGAGPYLVRATHQGASYFIAAPMGGGDGNITVYDVAAKVEGVGIDADMLLIEAQSGTLHVQERYLVRNTSQPPRAQFSDNTFEVVLPQNAVLDGASTTRPGGMGTVTHLTPQSAKGHYTFNVPIQPNQGEKETMFEVEYHLPYSGKATLTPQLTMHADNLVVYLPKSMTFTPGSGMSFQPSQEAPMLQTFIQKNVQPGQKISFTLQGEGQVQREQPQAGGMGMGGGAMSTPGGGIGAPINTPDPLTKYKWWILATLALAFAGGSAFFLRRKSTVAAVPGGATTHAASNVDWTPQVHAPAPAATQQRQESAQRIDTNRTATFLSLIKEELFAIETEKLSGTMTDADYAELKAGLQALLKRQLNKN